MRILNTLTPYKILDYGGIEYNVCREFNHINRYKGLRQVAHLPDTCDRYMTLEVVNPFTTNTQVRYHDVTNLEENRLDILAEKLLGSSQYAWVIALFNNIDDGFTVRAGQRIVVPLNVTSLFSTGEILQSIPATQLNIGEE